VAAEDPRRPWTGEQGADSAEPAPGSRRAWAGRVAGPALAVAVYLLLPGEPELADAARGTAAVGTLMATWWITEALPLPATALLPVALFPLAGVLPVAEAAAPYASDIIFLFMGGFMLALAMQRWGLHRRIALLTVLAVGTRPTRVVAGFMVATAFLSMWVSNTATTVMMLPIGVSVLHLVFDRVDDVDADTVTGPGAPNFATCLMLAIAYAASIGSLGTLIGTPPNLFMAGFIGETYGIDIGFGQWMLFGLPLAVVLLGIAWLLLTRVVYPTSLAEIPGGRQLFHRELAGLGAVHRGEKLVGAVFALTAAAWLLREPLTGWAWLAERVPAVTALSDPGIAIIAAVALFALPVHPRRGVFVLDWATARRLPWGVLLLFGGGLSLARAVGDSGLDAWIGAQVGGLGGLPTLALVVIAAAAVIFLTELTSNTATAATFLPILGGVALGLGLDPLLLVVPATLAATCAFMMPVATPPNAIVFGSGYVTIPQMVRAGVWLNVVAVVLVTGLVYVLGPGVLGIGLG
jgi:solute carrier family 13 (sodium-dependent dicarboxylate transporter), member 2/3/5